MIGQLLRDLFSQANIKELLNNTIVSGCLFRSFEQFTQNIIFRIMTNGGQIQKSFLLKQFASQASILRFNAVISNLKMLQILLKTDQIIRINPIFDQRFSQFIQNPPTYLGQQLKFQYDNQFFNLLYLLREQDPLNIQILRKCKITKLNSIQPLSKQNFDFIRSSISNKILILLRGYIRLNPTMFVYILELSMMKRRHMYKIHSRNHQALRRLQSIKLVKCLNANYFIISDYLHHFGFDDNLFSNHQELKCDIIIQSNFKVYTQVKPASHQNYQLLKVILKSLLKIQHQQYNINDELIVGQIAFQKLKHLFLNNISAEEYFSFFRTYMKEDLSIEKDLGKWNKLKYLGLEGPSNESSIPNNVKQEVKLWKDMSLKGNMSLQNEPEYYDSQND